MAVSSTEDLCSSQPGQEGTAGSNLLVIRVSMFNGCAPTECARLIAFLCHKLIARSQDWPEDTKRCSIRAASAAHWTWEKGRP